MPLETVSQLMRQLFSQGPTMLPTSAPAPTPAPAPAPARPVAPPPPPPSDRLRIEASAPRLQPMQVLLGHPGGVERGPGAKDATVKALETIPGKAWAGTLDGNGGREAAILMPQPFDASKPAEVIFYFHGHHGTIADSLSDGQKGMSAAIQELAKTRNVVLVLPQGPSKERDYTWMNAQAKESLSSFQAAALARIDQMAPGAQITRVTLKGHSAGGLPLLNGAAEAGVRADRIDFLDASYGSWASGTWAKLKNRLPPPALNVVYIPGTGTEADAKRLKGVAGVKLSTSNVDHGRVPKTFLGAP